MENEIWKTVVGYEGIYEISNFARLKSLARKSGVRNVPEKILKPYKNPSGYNCTILSKNNIKESITIHRLVLKTFKPNDDMKLFVLHNDGNPENSNLSNLRWGTQK